jgi:hypothetical protein
MIAKRYDTCCISDELGRKEDVEKVTNIGNKHKSVSSE